MKNLITSESTLTDRYQTTVPEAVRKALNLGKREKIRYDIMADGSVLLSKSKAQGAQRDPVIAEFLNFLARDMKDNPGTLEVLTPTLVAQLDNLVGDVDVDLDAPLSGE